MAGAMTYLDASAIIRLVDGDQPARQRIEELMRQHPNPVVTSVISMIECRSKPMRDGDLARVALYDSFFAAADVTTMPLDSATADHATRLRAQYNLKTPDAIHMATAVQHNASLLITTDHDFVRCRGLPGLTIELVPIT
jgi:predicted nucleic acid-binding protein